MQKIEGVRAPRHAKRRAETDKKPSKKMAAHRVLLNKRGNLVISAPVRSLSGVLGEIVGYQGVRPLARFLPETGDQALIYHVFFEGEYDRGGFPVVRFAPSRVRPLAYAA